MAEMNRIGDEDFQKKMLALVCILELQSNEDTEINIEESVISQFIQSFHPDAIEFSVTLINFLTKLINSQNGFNIVWNALIKTRKSKKLPNRFAYFLDTLTTNSNIILIDSLSSFL